ncbi:hypothetical protein Droror1_Dr00024790 [Drosera rotundifolia]
MLRGHSDTCELLVWVLSLLVEPLNKLKRQVPRYLRRTLVVRGKLGNPRLVCVDPASRRVAELGLVFGELEHVFGTARKPLVVSVYLPRDANVLEFVKISAVEVELIWWRAAGLLGSLLWSCAQYLDLGKLFNLGEG